jgi:small subunit ribosomal protein S17
MADEEKQEQEEQTPAEDAAPEEGSTPAEETPAEDEAAGASDEVAEQASEPAATSEPEPADTGREAEDVGGEVPAEQASEPAATSEPEPAAAQGEAEDVGEGAQEEALSPKELRKRERSRASGPARPERSTEERATERAERRGAAAESRRRHRAARRRKRGEPGTGTPPAPRDPGPKKVRQGTVVSTGGDKTITVEIAVVRRHPTYEKVVRRTSKLRAHDEGNEARQGDVVRLVESRPLSKTKRWRLLDVLERAPR